MIYLDEEKITYSYNLGGQLEKVHGYKSYGYDYVDGEVVQHIEYVPFCEVFIEERNNIWNSPYLFNAKKFDEETGLYYYGARYYEPMVSLWMNVDGTLSKRKNKRNKI